MHAIPFSKAINEALHQACELSDDVVVLGQLVDYKSGVFGTTTGLVDRFGPRRIQDFPVAEGLMTSCAIGCAVAGLRPVLVHQRLDFMLYSLDAIANWLALWRFKSDGRSAAPVTIRVIVGKGWGQGPQHSKSLHSWFAHLPGLRVAVPSTAYDAKGLLLESIFGEDPVVVVENRSLFSMVDEVPEEPYRVRFGQAARRRVGQDVTIAAVGTMVPLALRVADLLQDDGLSAEVLDLRTVSPLDVPSVCASVHKTRRLVVADPAWQSVSVSAEVVAGVCAQAGDRLDARPARVCLPDSHTPMSQTLEKEYYPDEASFLAVVRKVCGRSEGAVMRRAG
jgi:pyruvate dehydrogenase E1 component beta subunit